MWRSIILFEKELNYVFFLTSHFKVVLFYRHSVYSSARFCSSFFFSSRILSCGKTGALSTFFQLSCRRREVTLARVSQYTWKKKKRGNTNRFARARAQVRNGRTRFLPAAERHFWRHSTRFRAGIPWSRIPRARYLLRGFAKMRGEKGERMEKRAGKENERGKAGYTLALVQASPPGESLFAVCESRPDRSRDG